MENYYRDQILLLEEKLTEAKRDQAIAERAQKNEMRRLVREHKSENKAQILRIKEKLAADAEDLMYQEAELDRLRALIRFELQ